MTDDVFFATIPELNARLKKHEFSAIELAKAFGARLETLGPKYNALALPLTRVALDQAKAVDKDLKIERYRGPLQGVPFGAKDLLSFAGHPTTWGAKPYATQVLDETATVLQKLDDTGSLLMGKLSMVELAGGPGYRLAGASLTGPGLNPWDITRWSGGSSSGTGQRGRRGTGHLRARFGDFRLDHYAGGILRCNRPTTHLWPCQPARRHGTFLDAR